MFWKESTVEQQMIQWALQTLAVFTENMNSGVWKWPVGFVLFLTWISVTGDAAWILVALKMAAEAGSTHGSLRVSNPPELAPLQWAVLAWKQLLITSCHALRLRSLKYLGLSPPQAFSWIETPRVGALPGTGNLNHESHTWRTKGIFIFLCPILTFSFCCCC